MALRDFYIHIYGAAEDAPKFTNRREVGAEDEILLTDPDNRGIVDSLSSSFSTLGSSSGSYSF
jgi:hypothetical protein